MISPGQDTIHSRTSHLKVLILWTFWTLTTLIPNTKEENEETTTMSQYFQEEPEVSGPCRGLLYRVQYEQDTNHFQDTEGVQHHEV